MVILPQYDTVCHINSLTNSSKYTGTDVRVISNQTDNPEELRINLEFVQDITFGWHIACHLVPNRGPSNNVV